MKEPACFLSVQREVSSYLQAFVYSSEVTLMVRSELMGLSRTQNHLLKACPEIDLRWSFCEYKIVC